MPIHKAEFDAFVQSFYPGAPPVPAERSYDDAVRTLMADLKHKCEDNARLIAENKKLGEQVELLLGERNDFEAEADELRGRCDSLGEMLMRPRPGQDPAPVVCCNTCALVDGKPHCWCKP